MRSHPIFVDQLPLKTIDSVEKLLVFFPVKSENYGGPTTVRQVLSRLVKASTNQALTSRFAF